MCSHRFVRTFCPGCPRACILVFRVSTGYITTCSAVPANAPDKANCFERSSIHFDSSANDVLIPVVFLERLQPPLGFVSPFSRPIGSVLLFLVPSRLHVIFMHLSLRVSASHPRQETSHVHLERTSRRRTCLVVCVRTTPLFGSYTPPPVSPTGRTRPSTRHTPFDSHTHFQQRKRSTRFQDHAVRRRTVPFHPPQQGKPSPIRSIVRSCLFLSSNSVPCHRLHLHGPSSIPRVTWVASHSHRLRHVSSLIPSILVVLHPFQRRCTSIVPSMPTGPSSFDEHQTHLPPETNPYPYAYGYGPSIPLPSAPLGIRTEGVSARTGVWPTTGCIPEEGTTGEWKGCEGETRGV